MSSENYCPYCGSAIKAGDAFCNNCGASVDKAAQPSQPKYSTPQQPTYTTPAQPLYPQQPQQYGTQTVYGQPATYAQVEKNQAADNALVFGIVGLFCTPFAIAALILGIIGLSKPYGKSKAIWGIVLGSCVILIAVVSLIFSFLPY